MGELIIPSKFDVHKNDNTVNIVNPYRFDSGGVTSPIVQEGLVLEYDISDPASYPGSGTLVTDLSPSGIDMTLEGGVGYSDTDKMLVFSATAHKGRFSGNALAVGTGGFTVEFFVYFTSINTTRGALFSTATTQSDKRGVDIERHRAFVGYSGDGSVLSVTPEVPPIKHHYVIRRSADGLTLTALINGVVTDETTFETPQNLTSIQGVIGSVYADLNLSELRSGGIGVLRMYNRHLSDPEVNQNFNAQRSRYGI